MKGSYAGRPQIVLGDNKLTKHVKSQARRLRGRSEADWDPGVLFAYKAGGDRGRVRFWSPAIEALAKPLPEVKFMPDRIVRARAGHLPQRGISQNVTADHIQAQDSAVESNFQPLAEAMEKVAEVVHTPPATIQAEEPPQALFPNINFNEHEEEVRRTLQDLEYKKALLARFYAENPFLYFGLEVHRNTRGEPLDFTNKLWLQKIYAMNLMDDRYKQLVFQKSVQCGISEWMVMTIFKFAELGLKTLYVVPTVDLRTRFVSDRIERSIVQVPYYRHMLDNSEMVKLGGKASNKVSLKHIGKGSQFFAASNSENEFKEFSCDVVYIDELDQCNQDLIQMAWDRYSYSKHKISIQVSNPTHEAFGICQKYKEGTQGKWNIRCEHCGHWQVLDFWDHIVRDNDDGTYESHEKGYDPTSGRDPIVYCVDRECRKPLDRFGMGDWVHSYPDRDVVSLQISKLMQGPPMTSLRDLYIKYGKVRNNPTELAKMHNSDLGLGFSQVGQKLTTSIIEACISGEYRADDSMKKGKTGLRVMGVDVGTLLSVVIWDHPTSLDRPRMIHCSAVPTFTQLADIAKQWKVDLTVMDKYPEVRKAQEYQENNPKVILCEYTSNGQELAYDEDEGIVKIDRTVSLDKTVALYNEQDIQLPLNMLGIMGGKAVEELKASSRIFNPNLHKGQGAFQWVHNDPDHTLHAMNYANIAVEVYKSNRNFSPGIFLSERSPHSDSGQLSEYGSSMRELIQRNRRESRRDYEREYLNRVRAAKGLAPV